MILHLWSQLVRAYHVDIRMHAVQPTPHRRIETQIQRLNEHLVIFQIILRDHRVFLQSKGLAGNDERFGAFCQDDGLVC